MESVILAAGRGQRMEGVAKPFYKPLLEINGIPLLVYAAEYASAAGALRVTVVVSPHNIGDVEKVLKPYIPWVRIVVQEDPLGPGHAALVGLDQVTEDKTMLLMSDNIMDSAAVVSMATRCAIENKDAVGIRVVNPDQARRFTRVRCQDDGVLTYVEGGEIGEKDFWPGLGGSEKVKVWCGPLVFNSAKCRDVLRAEFALLDAQNSELKIGPYLNKIIGEDPILVDVQSMDVGIPSVYSELTK